MTVPPDPAAPCVVPGMGAWIDWAARLITTREGVISAAAGCLQAAGHLAPEQVAVFGGLDVATALHQLSAGFKGGPLEHIEAGARALSAAVQTTCTYAEDDGAASIAFAGAVLLLRGRLMMLDDADTAAKDTSLTTLGEGHRVSEIVRGCFVQVRELDGGININLRVPRIPPPPHQLPPARPVTRPMVQAVVQAVEQLFAEHQQNHPELPLIIVLTGPPGAGATTAALGFLHRLAREDHDRAELYADLAHAGDGDTPPLPPADVLHRWLRDLGAPVDQFPPGTAERAAWFRSLTQAGPVVLIDGAISAAQVRPLLPGGPSVVLVTSRSSLAALTLNGARHVALDPIEERTADDR